MMLNYSNISRINQASFTHFANRDCAAIGVHILALCPDSSNLGPSVWIYCVEGSNISETVDEDNLEYNLEFKTAIRDNSLDYDNVFWLREWISSSFHSLVVQVYGRNIPF